MIETSNKTTTVNDIITEVTSSFANNDVDNPRSASIWLLSDVLKLPNNQLFLNLDRTVATKDIALIRQYRDRVIDGEPLQYITGTTYFYNSVLDVGDGSFIPRPETERIVELALERYRYSGDILDLCTGSAAIPLALADSLTRKTRIVGVDCSLSALKWARLNAKKRGHHTIDLYLGDLFSPLPINSEFAIITANPPYISPEDCASLPKCVRDYEPHIALFAGENGLRIIRRIAETGQKYLISDGWLLCEIGESQGDETLRIFQANNWCNISIAKDYTDRDRVLVAQKNTY